MTNPQTPTDDDLPDAIVQLFAQGQARRDTAVADLLAGLTERERGLVRDAAVMGWVQGLRHHDVKYPGDQTAVAIVVDACLSQTFKDLYPTINQRRKKRAAATVPSTVES